MARHATNRNVNFGPMGLLAGVATDVLGYLFWRTNSIVRVPGSGSTPLSRAGLSVANGKFYFAIDNGAWTIYSYEPGVGLEEVTTVTSGQFADINQVFADSNENIYTLDDNTEVAKVSAAGVAWGPHTVNISGATSPLIRGIKVLNDRLFIAATDSNNYGFVFECNTTDSTSNANGSRLCIRVPSVMVFGYWGDIAVDTVNNNVLIAGTNLAVSPTLMNVKIYGQGQTGTTEVNSFSIDPGADLFETTNWRHGNFVHHDPLNDQWIFCFQTTGGKTVMQIDSLTDTINGQKESTTIGILYQSCVDADGNIYMLFENNEIVMMDDTLTVVWQSQVTSTDTTFYVRAIAVDSVSGMVGILCHTDTTYDHAHFLTFPRATGEAQYTFSSAFGGSPETVTIANMTADSWASPGWTLGAFGTSADQPTTMALNNDTDGTTGTNNITVETKTG